MIVAQSLSGWAAIPAAVWDVPVGRDDVEGVIDEVVFEDPVIGCAGGQRGGGIDLNKPWLQLVINDDVIAITLKTVLIIVHYGSDGLQRLHHDPVDLVEQPVGHILSSGAFKVQTEITDCPFAPMDVVVVIPVFLDGHISKMDKHVVQFTCAGCVLHRAEPTEAQLVPESQTPEKSLNSFR